MRIYVHVYTRVYTAYTAYVYTLYVYYIGTSYVYIFYGHRRLVFFGRHAIQTLYPITTHLTHAPMMIAPRPGRFIARVCANAGASGVCADGVVSCHHQLGHRHWRGIARPQLHPRQPDRNGLCDAKPGRRLRALFDRLQRQQQPLPFPDGLQHTAR